MDAHTTEVQTAANELLIRARTEAGKAARTADGRLHPSKWTLTKDQFGPLCARVAVIKQWIATEEEVHKGRMGELSKELEELEGLVGKPMLRYAQAHIKGKKKKSFEVARAAIVKLRKQQHKLTEVEPDAVKKWVMLHYPEYVVRVVTSEKLSQDELESFVAAMEALPDELAEKISWKTSWPKKVLTDHLKGVKCGLCGGKGVFGAKDGTGPPEFCRQCGGTGGEIPGGCTAIAAEDKMYIDPVLAVVAAPKQLEQGLTTDDLLPSPVNEGEEVLPL